MRSHRSTKAMNRDKFTQGKRWVVKVGSSWLPMTGWGWTAWLLQTGQDSWSASRRPVCNLYSCPVARWQKASAVWVC